MKGIPKLPGYHAVGTTKRHGLLMDETWADYEDEEGHVIRYRLDRSPTTLTLVIAAVVLLIAAAIAVQSST